MRKIASFLLLPLLAVLFVPFISFAQEGEQEVEAFIREVFEIKFNEIAESRDPGAFVKYFDPNFKGVIIGVEIDGRVTVERLDMDNIKSELKSYMGRGNLKVHWNIVKINYVTKKEKTGLGSFLLRVTYMENEEVILEAMNFVEVVYKERHNGNKIVYLSMMHVDENVTVGNCYVDIYSQGNKFISQTYIPKGPAYEMRIDNFVIGGPDKNRWVRVNDGEFIYYWSAEGDVTTEKGGGKKLGTAKIPGTVIKMVLQDIEKDKCTIVTTKKKG